MNPFGIRFAGVVSRFSTVATLLVAAPALAQNPNDPNWLDNTVSSAEIEPHMPESKRAGIDRLVVLSGREAADQSVDGTYAKGAPGLAGGMAAGSDMARISREIGGVPINIPIPGVQLPATIIGGLWGISVAEIQEFRDELTEELTNSDSPALRNDGIALDAFWTIERLDDYDAELLNPDKEWPEDVDAALLTDFQEFSIDVDGDKAVITTAVIAILNDAASGAELYRTLVRYQDRDTLSNWTADDNALWRSYSNFARYYLGRAVAADIFSRVDLQYELLPAASDDTKFARRKKPRSLESKSLTPTLAWDFSLTGTEGYGSWAESIRSEDVTFDVEVFDNRQLVYDAQGVAGNAHQVGYEIEPCQTYRWSVRPVFQTGGKTRVGEWMRLPYDEGKKKKKESASSIETNPFGKGLQGREASTAPAYLQDFAELEIACKR